MNGLNRYKVTHTHSYKMLHHNTKEENRGDGNMKHTCTM